MQGHQSKQIYPHTQAPSSNTLKSKYHTDSTGSEYTSIVIVGEVKEKEYNETLLHMLEFHWTFCINKTPLPLISVYIKRKPYFILYISLKIQYTNKTEFSLSFQKAVTL